jgi:hypothetical protein
MWRLLTFITGYGAEASYDYNTGKVYTCFVSLLLEFNESRESGVAGYRYDPAVHNLPPHYPTLHNLTCTIRPCDKQVLKHSGSLTVRYLNNPPYNNKILPQNVN